MLRGRNLVVLGLGGDAKLPHMLVKVLHVACYAVLDSAEIVVVKLLSLGCGRAKERSARKDKVLSLIVGRLVYKEVLLLRAYRCNNSLCGGVAEQAEYSERRVGDNVHGAQQRGLLVKRLARIGVERRGDIERTTLYESVGGGVPCGVAPCLECSADTARGEAGSVRLALDKLLARELHDNGAVAHRGDEAVVLLSGDARHRLEPVGVVGRALFDCPVLHGACNNVRNRAVKLLALCNGLFESLENVLRKPLLHRFLIEYINAELLYNIKYFCHVPFPP